MLVFQLPTLRPHFYPSNHPSQETYVLLSIVIDHLRGIILQSHRNSSWRTARTSVRPPRKEPPGATPAEAACSSVDRARCSAPGGDGRQQNHRLSGCQSKHQSLGSAVIGGERLNLVGAARKVANDKDQDKQRTGAEQGRVVQHNISCTVADALDRKSVV